MQCGRAALDESTDVPNMSRFVVHARFGIWEWNTQRIIIIIIFNELYREDIISITDDLFNKSAVLWENSINITTDCVEALTAKHEGFQIKVMEIAPNMQFTQRLAVEVKKLRPEVHKMMEDAIDVVHIIKISLINSRFLTAFCNTGMEIWLFCNEIQRFDGYLVAECFNEMGNLKMSYAFFFYRKRRVSNLPTIFIMTTGCQYYAIQPKILK